MQTKHVESIHRLSSRPIEQLRQQSQGLRNGQRSRVGALLYTIRKTSTARSFADTDTAIVDKDFVDELNQVRQFGKALPRLAIWGGKAELMRYRYLIAP